MREKSPVIRRIRSTEGAEFRAIRLQALAESPSAFGSTLDETRARPMEYWRKRAASGAAEQESVLFLAEEAGGWVGIVGGFLEEEEGGRSVELVSMWVNPAYRGRRLGQRLVEQIIDWARQRGARRVTLWVTENNAGAISLYRRCGFRSTGETQELPSNPTLRELRMVVSLDDECPHQAR